MNPDENEKTKEKAPEKPGRPSRLGHEAKIGVAVILSLLAVLVAVAVVRLSATGSGEKAVAAADRDAGRQKPADRAKGDKLKDDKLFQGFNAKPFAAGGPTVVPAKAAVIGPPKAIDANLDPWKLASDKPEAKRPSGGELPPASPPLLMPEPSRPLPAGRYDDRASGPPFRYGAPNRGDEGGFASAGAAPPPAGPPRRENDRRDDSKATPPPAPPHRDHSYAGSTDRSAPVTPVSEFEAGDYRRDPPSPRYGGDEPRRGAPAPAYREPPPPYRDPPVRREDGQYEVQPNDNYWTISEKVYGLGAYFKALLEHNRRKGRNEEQLKPGDLVLTPPLLELEKSYPDLCPKPGRRETMQSRASTVSTRQSYRSGKSYTVVDGDTLFNIARYELGKASRWVEIYELNRDVLGKDFNYLTPGMKLVLPEGDRPDVIAQPPSGTYRR